MEYLDAQFATLKSRSDVACWCLSLGGVCWAGALGTFETRRNVCCMVAAFHLLLWLVVAIECHIVVLKHDLEIIA